MFGFYVFIFIISCLVLFWSGSRLVKGLMKIARFLGLREFVVAFLIVAVASSLPNLFVGINSAFKKIPQLSFGDIIGGNVVDLTLAIGLAVLIGGRNLSSKSKLVQTSSIFTVAIAILPLILVFDGILSRGDGLILIFSFIIYIFWLFSRKERFQKIYNNDFHKKEAIEGLKGFFRGVEMVIISLIALLLASEGIVRSAAVFADVLGMSIPLVGILIVGLGNALPEIYFAVVSAKKKQTFMILGDLMGSVIISATLVLGIVVLITPIEISDFSSFVIARAFLIISALFFFIALRTNRKITKIEGLFFILIYIIFLISEIVLTRDILHLG